MILVFDTNALISAFITAGPSRDVFEYAARNHHVVTSSYILGELVGSNAAAVMEQEISSIQFSAPATSNRT